MSTWGQARGKELPTTLWEASEPFCDDRVPTGALVPARHSEPSIVKRRPALRWGIPKRLRLDTACRTQTAEIGYGTTWLWYRATEPKARGTDDSGWTSAIKPGSTRDRAGPSHNISNRSIWDCVTTDELLWTPLPVSGKQPRHQCQIAIGETRYASPIAHSHLRTFAPSHLRTFAPSLS